MDRLQYAETHRTQYMGYVQKVANGPATPLRRMEFALLSAHIPFGTAAATWQAIEHAATMGELEAAFQEHGMWPMRKVLSIQRLREEYTYPTYPYREWRESVKLPGLGRCKASFACCLIDPLGSDAVCLDTHMVQQYTGTVPPNHWWDSRARYEEVEDQVLREAAAARMPPFGYQWLIWDMQRGKPETHMFLWDTP